MSSSSIPERISHYRIIERLGAGGMGEVYLAEDTKLGRKVAIKILGSEFTTNRDRLNRFEQEACAASSLNHPNILTIYEVGDDDGRHFIATEFIDGVTLRHKLNGAPLEIPQILEIAIQIAGALDEAHSAGIVHRDIKPENIMVRRNGYAKLLDFGLAKLTKNVTERQPSDNEASTRVFVQTDAGVVMGTSHYMSPEQARGQQVDARTDIWSLGVVMFEMISGKAPFTGDTSTDVLVAITQKEPPSLARFTPNVPAEFEWIVTKALRKDREERYQTAREMMTDLRRLKQRLEFEVELERSVAPERLAELATLSDHGTVRTSAPHEAATAAESAVTRASSAEYIVSEIKRHKTGVAIVGIVLLLAVGALVFMFLNRSQPLTDKDTVLIADFVNLTGEPVFDLTLKQALAVQLAQSPFLNFYPDERVREALRFMGRSPDERLTKEIAREICERQGLKALLAGSISSLGSHYVITLEAINAHSGESIAREQAEAESKERVLSALSQAATDLRRKLGESLSSIKKFDVPAEQATTSSLEALKAYAMANDERTRGRAIEAAKLYKRAIELDPNFAMAYARLAVFHGNLFQWEDAQKYAQKAFELRDRVSEHEKFYISEKYYNYVTGEIDKTIDVLQTWARLYPNDFIPHNNLALNYLYFGQYEQALKEALEAVRLSPNNTSARDNLINSFMFLGRIDEARQALEDLRKLYPDSAVVHFNDFLFAAARKDEAAMQREVEWSRGKDLESDLVSMTAAFAFSVGEVKKSNEIRRRALELFKSQDRIENLAQNWAGFAYNLALVGSCQEAKQSADTAIALNNVRSVIPGAALAYALCNDAAQAQTLMADAVKRYPKDLPTVSMLAPQIRAQLERSQNNPAEAIQLLETVRRYDLGLIVGLFNNHLRGQAYLDQRLGNEAAAEFQKIIDMPAVEPFSPLHAIAHLGVARATALSGDLARSRTEYQNFFALWKNADADIPILVAARKEYEALK